MNSKPTYEELERRVRELENNLSFHRKKGEKPVAADASIDTVLDLSPFAMWVSDSSGTVIRTNRSLRETIKLTDEAIIGKYNVLQDENLIKSGVMPQVKDVFTKCEPTRFTVLWESELAGDVDFTGAKDMYIDVSMFPILDAHNELMNVVCQWVDITELKFAEQKVKSINQKYISLFNKIPVPIWEEDFTEVFAYFDTLRSQGIADFKNYFDENPEEVRSWSEKIKIVNVNKATVKLHGAESKEDLLGNLQKTFSEKSLNTFKEELIALANGETEIELEGEVKTLAGEPLNIWLKLTIEKRADNTYFALVTTIDTTHRKAYESRLKILNKAIDNSLNAFDIVDEGGKFIYVNNAYVSMWGYDNAKEIIGTSPSNHCVDPAMPEKIIRVLREKGEYEFELNAKKKDGSHFDVMMCARLAHDENGNEIYPTTSIDITRQKRSEKALRESEERFRAIYEHAPVLIDAFDDQGRCVLWNNACQETFGWTIEEINAHGDAISLFYPDPSVRDEVIRTVTTDPDARFREWHPVTKDGKTLITMWANFKLPDGLTFNLGYDITEQKLAEKEKAQLQEKLSQSQKMESIGKLAGGIAHDFNNILYPVIGFTQLSQYELPEDHPVQENLLDILNGAKRASDLVKRILHFSRQKDPELKPIVLQPVIRETQKLLRSTIPSNIDIRLNLYEGQDAVLCDESEIHEIILNLCTNAYQAIEGEQGRIIINFDRQHPPADTGLSPGEYLCLSVEDNGAGIPENIRDKIFEPYVTTKDVGKGSGLGLSVVYGIVKNYNGGIRFESRPETGTVFEIYLPVISEAVAVDTTQTPENFEQKGDDEHILFVDDESSVVKLGVRILEKSGFQVTGITDSKAALSAFISNPEGYDLVITDMAMPGMVGSALAREIVKIRPDIPVIICSGYSERLENEKEKGLSVSAVLDKPLSIDDLVKITREVLDKKKELGNKKAFNEIR